MSVRIRFKRAGSTHKPFYKIIVADSRSPRDGRVIEALGYYNPLKKPEIIEIDEERYSHWLSVGASVTEPVETLVKRMKRRAAGIEIPGEGDEPPHRELAVEPVVEAAPAKAEAETAEEAAPEGESDK